MSSIRHCVYRSRATNHKINYIIERREMLINLHDISYALGYVDTHQLMTVWSSKTQRSYDYYISITQLKTFYHRLRKGTKETRKRLLEEHETLKANNSFNNGRINNRVIDHSVERQEILYVPSLSNNDNERTQLVRHMERQHRQQTQQLRQQQQQQFRQLMQIIGPVA